MKTILLSTVALVGFTAGAMAADLPVRAAPPPPVVALPPAFTWTGFYIGVNGGVAFGDEDDRRGNNRRFHHHHHRLRDGDGIRDTVRNNRRNNGRNGGNNNNDDDISALGGGQIGYNMQFGMFVAGIEADIQAIDFQELNDRNRHRHHRPGGNNGGNNNGFNGRDSGDDVDAFGTVRGRLGFAAFDRGLLYATGGLAWKSDEDNNGGGGRNGRNNGGNNGDNIGYTVGGGFEYAFTNSISFKVEGLYVDFSEDNDRNGRNRNRNRRNNDNGFGDNNFSGDGREFGLVRAGINFRFNTF